MATEEGCGFTQYNIITFESIEDAINYFDYRSARVHKRTYEGKIMKKQNGSRIFALSVMCALALAGCGGGGGGDSSVPTATINTNIQEENDPKYQPYDAAPISEEDKAAYLDAINTERAQGKDCGTYGVFQPTQPVTWSDELYSAAAEHSYDMSIDGETNEDFGHVGTGSESDWTAQVLDLGRGSEFYERGANNGYDNNTRFSRSENAHASPETIDIAMEDFMESDGHCANIMDPGSNQVGIAMVYNPEGIWGYYWTQVFGIAQ